MTGLTKKDQKHLMLFSGRSHPALANEVAVYVSPVPMVHPELFLAAAAAMRREREYTALQLEQQHLARLSPALGGQPHGFPERG